MSNVKKFVTTGLPSKKICLRIVVGPLPAYCQKSLSTHCCWSTTSLSSKRICVRIVIGPLPAYRQKHLSMHCSWSTTSLDFRCGETQLSQL